MSTNMAAVMDLGSPVADMWALLTRLPIGLIAISLPVTVLTETAKQPFEY
jgi:hypothetical protein